MTAASPKPIRHAVPRPVRRATPKPGRRAAPADARIIRFRSALLRWFARHGRTHLPWRRTRNPWAVLVSELMLQQTQVSRVIPKYEAFLRHWPTPAALSAAPLGQVLAAWNGLGYNRRAKFLHLAARAVAKEHGGVLPRMPTALEALPGIGRYTARAVAAFAWNDDVALWDTNVRRVFLRVFHGGEFARRPLSDQALERLLARALPSGRSRDWHGALMDFGSAVCTSRAPSCAQCPLLKLCVAGPKFLRGARPERVLVKKQPLFEGSRRQVRGLALRLLAESGPVGMTPSALAAALVGQLDCTKQEALSVLADLRKEGLVTQKGKRIVLPTS